MAERNLDFDALVERRGSNCLKYDFAVPRGHSEDEIPLWVADMDFRTTSYVQDAVGALAEHGIAHIRKKRQYINPHRKVLSSA